MSGPEAIAIIKRLGISQRQFAFLCGLHPMAVSKWATGGQLSGPSETLMRLLDERPELLEVMKRLQAATDKAADKKVRK